jgi:hypothetical protein
VEFEVEWMQVGYCEKSSYWSHYPPNSVSVPFLGKRCVGSLLNSRKLIRQLHQYSRQFLRLRNLHGMTALNVFDNSARASAVYHHLLDLQRDRRVAYSTYVRHPAAKLSPIPGCPWTWRVKGYNALCYRRYRHGIGQIRK